jgi:hypothetical protein
VVRWFVLMAMILPTLAGEAAAEPLTMGPPIGASWGSAYGFPPQGPERFAPQARALGASFTRLTLYWSQLEPKAGEARWTDLDSYLAQVAKPDEGFLTIESASPWATREATWVFPSSPARREADYYAFVHAVVAHAKGRIRYFQSDQEPNNPFFWKGSAEEFAAQQRVFYRAVKDADPKAMVVLGGCDGLFDPTGAHPLPNQAADMAFWATVTAGAAGAYDVFDLRLYGDAYTIPARVDYVRGLMAKAGGIKPIVASEYNGPGFFDFPGNRRWAGGMMNPATAVATIGRLNATAETLPVETRMFLAGATAQDAAHLQALAADDLVTRNVLALAAGVQKTAYFDLWHDNAWAPPASAVMFGAFRLLDRTDGALAPAPLAKAFSELAGRLNGAVSVERVADAGSPEVFAFKIVRRGRGPIWVAWRKPAALGEAIAPTPLDAPWLPKRLRPLSVGSSPVFVE